MTPGPCPTKDQLTQYTLGTLSDDAVPELEEHLEVCPGCIETMLVLETQADAFTGMLRNRNDIQEVGFLNEEPYLSTVANLSRLAIAASDAESGNQQRLQPSVISPRVPQTGQQLGQYMLLELVGRGGMGFVYKARHVSLNKIVALKVLSVARVHEPRMRERFQREMHAAGKIEHPNIVRAIYSDESEGVQFLVMEFVDGVDLSALLKHHGPLSIEHACEMIRMAAVGLQQIHQAGMVHRDVKPGNLMLSRDGQVKVLDLGLALLNPQFSMSTEELTSAGQIMGTIDYMAPEQAEDTHTVDFRADIYGLGATLFALLTGRGPLGGRHLSLMKKLSVLANEPAPSVLEFRQDVPQNLAVIIAGMLNRDSTRRPASAAEISVALKPFCTQQGLFELSAGDGNASHAVSSVPGDDSVHDTVVLYGNTVSQATHYEAIDVATTTVTTSTKIWKVSLLLGFVTLLIGSRWFVLRPGTATNVAEAPGKTIEETQITQSGVGDNVVASDDSVLGSSTSAATPIALAALNSIATNSTASTSDVAAEPPWHVFSSDVEPDLRATAIHRAVDIVPVDTLLRQLLAEVNPSIRAGLLLAISEYDQHVILSAVSAMEGHETKTSKSLDLIDKLLHWYVKDPSPEVHTTVEFLLRRWGQQHRVQELRPIVEQRFIPFDGGWYQPLHVSAMVVIPGPRTDQVGSPTDEPGRFTSKEQHEELRTVTIPHTFAIGVTEVTRHQFWRSRENYWDSSPPTDPELPVNEVLWEQAAEFCNRLSLLEGLDEKNLCYVAVETADRIRWRQKPDALNLTGYRLPTDDEWEIACRAGTTTSRPAGNEPTWLDRYYVCNNTVSNPLNVGSRKPNSFGLSDMLGNVSEWIHSDASQAEQEQGRRRIRGGSLWTTQSALRSAARFHYPAYETTSKLGFRVARTIIRRPLQKEGHEQIMSRVEIQIGPPACMPQTEKYTDPQFTPLLDQQIVRFGTWDAMSQPIRSIRLKNCSEHPLRMSELPWMNGSFVLEPASTVEIAPNATVDFKIRIPIARVGEHTHDLRFRWEGIKDTDFPAVRLHGCLNGPLLDMFSIGHFGGLSHPANLGSVPYGSKAGIRFFVRNIGDQPVEAEVTDITGPFVLTAPLDGSLKPHTLDKSFRVMLDASHIGLAEGKITLKSKQDPPAVFSFPVRAEISDSKAFSAIGIFRSGKWLIDYNRDSVIDESIEFGRDGDRPLTGDWNGDGIADIAVWHPTGDGRIVIQFRLRGDSLQSVLEKTEIQLESSQWIPVAADLDGDGKSEIGYVSSQTPREGLVWAFDTQHDETYSHRFVFGSPGSDPVIGDWNGDGIDEVSVSFHGISAPRGARLWQIQQTDNAQPKERVYLSNLDVPLAGDWDGDGDDDLGGWRPEPNQKPCSWQFETSGDINSECDLEALGVETDIPFVLRHNEKRHAAD